MCEWKAVTSSFNNLFTLLSSKAAQGKNLVGGSPRLVVMGGDSCSEGCGFESQRSILDGDNI